MWPRATKSTDKQSGTFAVNQHNATSEHPAATTLSVVVLWLFLLWLRRLFFERIFPLLLRRVFGLEELSSAKGWLHVLSQAGTLWARELGLRKPLTPFLLALLRSTSCY